MTPTAEQVIYALAAQLENCRQLLADRRPDVVAVAAIERAYDALNRMKEWEKARDQKA